MEDNGSDTSLSASNVRITGGGASGNAVNSAIVLAQLASVPPSAHGGITANSVVSTLGILIIDGRDHDSNGALVTSQGTMGASTTQAYTQSGNSNGGGTSSSVDYSPSKPANPGIIEEQITYTFPSSPDAVFGYNDGELKAMAQSGANGGQYMTDPANFTLPLSGVTYVELPIGDSWQSMDFG